MSGHANFSAIEGVRPTLPAIQQPGEDIGVSLNKSVGGVNGPGASDAGGVKEEAPIKETSDAAEKTGALIRQLDVLLARAAESATKGIDQNTIRLSIGTEHIDDILADLEKGFAAAKQG